MSDSRAQTGVRSLLARFENNNNNNNSSTSPPSRGRSPIDQDRPGSVRPLSKVRASFVAVERTGQSGSAPMWGLRKASDLDSNNTNNSNSSTNNSPGKLTRTMSGGVDDVGSPMERSVTMSSNDSADKGAMMGRSLAPSSPDNNIINNNNGGPPGSGNINSPWAAKLPSRLIDSPTPGKQPTSGDTLMVATTTTKAKTEFGKNESKSDSQEEKLEATEVAQIAAAPTNGKLTDKAVPKKLNASMNPSSRPANIAIGNDANKTTSKKSSTKDLKSPLPRTPRTPTTTTSYSSAKTTPKETDRPRAAATKQPTRATAGKTTIKPQSSAPTRDRITKPSSENPPTNNRSRTRSPTRPVRLPNSMIAPTASSAAKLNLDGRPASQAGTRTSNLNRKPSSLRSGRNTTSSRATGPAAASTAQKQSTRASSLAPQQNTAHDRPRSRVSNVGGARSADESFLARMMRPTASSASKMHEKVEIKSPPRGSGPPKVRRKSGESSSSHVSASVSVTASTPPSSRKRGVKAAQALSLNEHRNEPDPDGTQAQAQVQNEDTTAAATKVEIAIQEPESEPTLGSEREPEPTVAEPEPTPTEPASEPETEPVAEPELSLSEPTVSEPAATSDTVELETEPEQVISEPTAPEPAATEHIPVPLPDLAELSVVADDPANVPLPEATEHVEL